MKKIIPYIIVILAPMVIFFIASFMGNFIPFGDLAYNIYDSSAQFPGIYLQLKNMILFNFTAGLGFNFLGTATYYLLSPVNILLVFFDNLSFYIFYAISIYLKIALASLFMYLFLSNLENKKNVWTILFSIAYSLCGFMSAYYYNTMWIDGVAMLPLILLGINKLIKENKKSLYLISLSLAIIINYYIGYMLCIFSVIYFMYSIITIDNIDKKKSIKNFIISSLLAGLIACIVIIPAGYALMQGKASGYGSDFTNYFEISDNILYTFYYLTSGSYQMGNQVIGNAQIYSTMLAFVLAVLFFFNTKFSKKHKIVVGLILIFYFISFNFNLIDYAWQFFQKPVWWQSRYSFTFSAFIIIIAYKSICNIDTLNFSKTKKLIVIPVICILIITSFLIYYNNINHYKIMGIVFLVISMLIIIDYFIIIGNKKMRWFVITLIFVELFLNTFNNLKKNSTSTAISYVNSAKETRQNAVDKIQEYDNSFYRMEFVSRYSSNDGMMFNYNGITFFNSVRNQNYVNFAEYVLNQKVDSHCGTYLNYFNPYFMSLLNVKYLMTYEIDYYEKVTEANASSGYLNPYPLSTGFMVNKSLLDANIISKETEHNLNEIFSKMINEEINAYKYIEGEFIADKDYLLISKDNKVNSYEINGKDYVIRPLKMIYKGDKIITTEITKILDMETYKKVMQNLSKDLMNVDYSNNRFKGNVVATEDKSLLLLTIPYDEGITLKVDGKKVKPIKILDAFIGLELDEGLHDIELEYMPKGLIIGATASLSGIVLSIIFLQRKKLK